MAPQAQIQHSPSPSQPSGKNEVTDLKSQLRQLAGSRAMGVDDSKRDLFKKVISYMTIGIDVSSLFSEMVMCSATSDIVLKKMCYLYVGNHAKGNPDLALLTINFLQKDCKDEDPMIRGLALRSLCSLRVANLVEYLVGPLGLGLNDGNSYVRMVSVVGVLKLHHISHTTCMESDFPASLKHLLLTDPDPQVVVNCLSALQEIWASESITSDEASREREALTQKPVIYHLLNRMKEFSEWAQCVVLEVVAKYIPWNGDEVFDIMNVLEERLQHANGAVVLATTKVFLQLTLSMAETHQQVYARIKAPLLTLVRSGSTEQSYAVLAHLHLLVMRAPALFASDYKHFYCQYKDPFYVKKLKLEMLTAVVNESNTYEIVTELCEYAANVDVPIARESIRAVGKIALQKYDVNAIVDRLLQFLEMDKDHITAETLVLVKDLLRKYPQWSCDCIAVVGNIGNKNLQEPEAKAALIWMLGEYSRDIPDAPYVLESLVQNWDEERSPEVRLHLLTAAMKCFFRRAPESRKCLGAALRAGLSDFHQDVRDRSLFYYRLLRHDVSVAERVVNPPKRAVSVFTDVHGCEARDRIFDEFNSLSVVYQKASFMFVDGVRARAGEDDGTMASEDDGTGDLLLNLNSTQGQEEEEEGTEVAASAIHDDLLGLAEHGRGVPLRLNPGFTSDAASFQTKWKGLPVCLSLSLPVTPQGVATLRTPHLFAHHMDSRSIRCVASGGHPPTFKFFLAAQAEAETSVFLVECVINASSANAHVRVKADDAKASDAFFDLFQSALSDLKPPA